MSVESMAAFARRLGVARSTVTRWAKAGRIELAPNGKVLVEESMKRLAQTGGTRPDVAERHGKKRAQMHQETVPQTSSAAEERTASENAAGVEAALANYKAQALKYRNSLTKLELSIDRGEWLEREAHARALGDLGKRLRQGLENLTDSLAPRMAIGLADAATIRSEIEQLIEEVLGA